MTRPDEPPTDLALELMEHAAQVNLDEFDLSEVAARADDLQAAVLTLLAEVRRLRALAVAK